MPIPFTCPYCGEQTMVADHLAGTSGTCGTCAQPISIPIGVPEKRTPAPKANNTGLIAAFIVLGIVLAGSMLGLVGWMIIPVFTMAASAEHSAACGNNLRAIAQALQNYHDDHGSYPPAYLADKNGTPMHSWRVLILPYLGEIEDEVYQEYSFAEPWNGPNNSRLTGRMPKVYFCPQNPDQSAKRAGETNYMVIRGDETMFPGEATTSDDDVADGLSNTILVVETTAKGVNWMKPQDLDIDDMKMEINAGPKEPGSFHPEGGVHVVMVDGTVHFLSQKTRKREMYSSVTRAGGEPPHLTAVE